MARRSKKKDSLPEVSREAQSPAKKTPKTTNGMLLLQVLTIVVATFWIFSPAMDGDWLWDDQVDITENDVIHDPAGLWKIWFEPGSQVDYYPIKASVQWMEWQLWHTHTFGYHFINVLLHIVSALLIWRLLSKFGIRFAWLGGLIFAIHPVQVESVAWVAELKNTLSLPPFLLAMCFYIDYENGQKKRDYFSALAFFLAAMLCKPTMVMFPVVILLYAWWKRDRIRWRDLKSSAPFFLVSLALGIVTIFVKNWYLEIHHTTATTQPMGGLFSRLDLAGLSISFYFFKCFWPATLMTLYPKWPVDPSLLLQFLPWPILGGIVYWLWTKRASWGRHALLGLGFFLINLAPFIGFIEIDYMRLTWVMDHFLYIPIIGLIGLVMAGLGQIADKLSPAVRPFGAGIIAIVMALLAWKSHEHAANFVNKETLWTHTLQYNPEAWLAYNDLGVILRQAGQVPEAIERYNQALTYNPDYADAHNNLANALFLMGRIPEAIEHYKQALKINPALITARYNLGCVLLQSGRFPEAIEQFEEVLKNNPDYATAHDNLGLAFAQTGRIPEAVEQFEEALKINPDYADARNNLERLQKAFGENPKPGFQKN